MKQAKTPFMSKPFFIKKEKEIKLVLNLLENAGYTVEESECITEVLLDQNLSFQHRRKHIIECFKVYNKSGISCNLAIDKLKLLTNFSDEDIRGLQHESVILKI